MLFLTHYPISCLVYLAKERVKISIFDYLRVNLKNSDCIILTTLPSFFNTQPGLRTEAVTLTDYMFKFIYQSVLSIEFQM